MLNLRLLRRWYCRIILFSLVVCLGLTQSMSVSADSETKNSSNDKLDAVLLLDASGSMLMTDPQRLRDQGSRLFTQFLKPEDRLAIVTFSGTAEVLRPLVPYNPQFADEIEASVKRVETKGIYTDLLASIRTAKTMLNDNPREGAAQIIVLLSDGKMDPDPLVGSSQALTAELLNVALPELKAKGIKVYTLAFSEEADKDLLSSIALGTDGIHWYTADAQTVHKSYADLFLAVKKPQMVPLTSKGFQVDADVQEATFYVSREEGPELEVMSPSGLTITSASKAENVRWFKSDKFDVITILQPEVGNWKVSGLKPEEGFATILTNLKLVTEWASTVTAEEEQLLEARLYESDKPVSLPEVSGVSKFGFQITPTDQVSEPIIREFLYDDGTHGDKIAKDGVFSAIVILDSPGEYRLRVVAQAPTFQRTQQIPFRVKPPLVKLYVMSKENAEEGTVAKAAEGDHATDHGSEEKQSGPKKGKAGDYFVLELSDEAAQFKGVETKLLAISEKRVRYYLPLVKGEGHPIRYEVTSAALPYDGEYELEASLSGVSKTRKLVKSKSRKLHYKKSQAESHGDDEPTAIVIEGEKPPEPEGFPFIPLGIVTVVNIIAGIMAMSMLKKSLGQMVLAAPQFAAPTKINAVLEDLKKRVEVEDVDLNDAFFTSAESESIPSRPSTAQPAPEEPAAEASEAPAEPEASAPPAEGAEASAEEAPPAEEPKKEGE